jgi:hypothetical protein
MKEKRKIILGKKDVFPYKNKENYINVEIFRTSDEIINEVIDNNFNLSEQFYNERQSSLKFCVYGVLNSIYTDTQNVEINIKTNHDDIIHVPRISQDSTSSKIHNINSFSFSQNNTLSKNIFNKNKSMFYFLFELSPFYNNQGETKSLILSINDAEKKLFLNQEIPFLFFDSEQNKIPYGTETVDYNSDGSEQVVRNDFSFFYDTHWVKSYINVNRPRKVSFIRSLEQELDNDTVLENVGKYKFTIKLDEPSFYGVEEVEVFILEDDTERGLNENYKFKNQIIKWEKGEQYKNVEIEIIDDLFVEGDSYLIFGIKNLKFVDNDIKNQTFKLNIIDNDKPTPIGFSVNTNTVSKKDGQISIELFLEQPIPVPNQTVDIIMVKNNKITTEGTENLSSDLEIFKELKSRSDFKVFQRGFEADIKQADTLEQISLKLSKLNYYLQFNPLFRISEIAKDAEKIISENIDLQAVFNSPENEGFIETTAVIGEDFEFSEIIDGELVAKTIQIPPGVQFLSFSLNLIDDFNVNYELDKNIILKITNPSKNVKIDESRDAFVLIVKNSLTPKYTRYKILGENSNGNNGIFLLTFPFQTNVNEPINMLKTDSLNVDNSQHFLTNNFPLNISVKNKGVPIVYENKLIATDEFFILKQLTPNNQDVFFDLPSNTDLNVEKKQYNKSFYEFNFEIDRERFSEITSNPILLTSLKSAYNPTAFPVIVTDTQKLDSSDKKGEKEYYLVSEIENVVSNLRKNSEYHVYLRAKEAGVLKDDNFEQVFNKIQSLSFYLSISPSLRTVTINQDVQIILNENLDWQNINLNDISFKYICGNFKQPNPSQNITNVKINGTLLLPKNNLSNFQLNSSFISNNNIFPSSKLLNVKFEESPIVDFCSVQNFSQNLITSPLSTLDSINSNIIVEPLN